MVERLSSAVNGEKTQVIDYYAGLTGKSPAQLYRIAAKHGYSAGRKRRCDHGECCLTEQQILYVAGLIQTSSRLNKKTIMSCQDALEIAERNGIIEPGTVSVARLSGILRERDLSAEVMKTPTPHVNMRSLHPNHVHQVDVSVCIQYYLSNKVLKILPENEFYKNKFENFARIKQKIFRYVMVDHYSHAIYVKYYIGTGETQDNLFDFLCSAWGEKDPRLPFHGVCFVLMLDRGAANKSQGIRNFIKNLDVLLSLPADKNARRQGSVEKAQDIVEKAFESRLRFSPVDEIDRLNDLAISWCIGFNANRIHNRHKMTRSACWMTITDEQLRKLPSIDILQSIFREHKKPCHVYGDYTIKFRGEVYRIKHVEGLVPNKSQVDVIYRPFSWPEVTVVFDDIEYVAKPLETVAGGFYADSPVIEAEYKAHPESPTQKGLKKIENLAYGAERKKNAIPFEGIEVLGYQGDDVPEYMPKRGTVMDMGAAAYDVREVPLIEFIQRLVREFGPLSFDENKMIRIVFRGTIPAVSADEIVDLVHQGESVIDAVSRYTEAERKAV
jgi:hypothetical protein